MKMQDKLLSMAGRHYTVFPCLLYAWRPGWHKGLSEVFYELSPTAWYGLDHAGKMVKTAVAISIWT